MGWTTRTNEHDSLITLIVTMVLIFQSHDRAVLSLPLPRDTYPVFLKWLQLMASSELSSLGTGEGRRVAALLAVAESVVHVAAITPDMLKIEGGGMCVCAHRLSAYSSMHPEIGALLTQ